MSEQKNITQMSEQKTPLEQEPITVEDESRFCLFPIENEDIWKLYKLHEQKFWTAEEVDFSGDLESWKTLNKQEQDYISVTLAFFANSDNIVLENLATRFMKEIQLPEETAFLSFQSAMETVHVTTYNMCIDVLIQDKQKKEDLFTAITTNPIVQPKLKWTLKWANSEKSLAHRLIAFCAVEGIFFSSSFASMFWLRKRQKLPGVCFANEKIVEDESLHVRNMVMLYKNYIKYKLDEKTVHNIIRDAVEIEHQFTCDALPVKLIGINQDLMKQYVCNVADTILELLGVSKIYNVENPFTWMVGLGLMGKANFFEKKVAEYNRISKEDTIRTEYVVGLGNDLDF